MELKFEVIAAKEIEVGDIFYCTPDFDMNEFGQDVLITGSDQIFIMDDLDDEDECGNYSILVNGGWTITFKSGQKVVRLAHYRDILRVLEMVKLGEPDMQVGENDSTTLIHEFMEDNPHMKFDLLDGMDLNIEGAGDEDEEAGRDEEDEDLPF